MAAKKIKSELESVRGDLRELTEAVWALRDQLTTEQAVAAAERQTRHRPGPDGHDAAAMESLTAIGAPGSISISGNVVAPTGPAERRAVRWSLAEHPIAGLLAAPVEAHASVLAAIGHRQRLAILLHLLAQPATAVELVGALTLGTTGAAYHHVNVLQAAGLVEQRERGVFTVVPARVPTLLTILGGLSDALAVEVGPVAEALDDAAAPHSLESGDGAGAPADEAPVPDVKPKKGKKATG